MVHMRDRGHMLPRGAAKIAISEGALPDEAENMSPKYDRLQLRANKAVNYIRVAI